MAAYLIGALVFAAGVAVFVMQNTAAVSVRFINWVSPEVSVAVVALVAALLGTFSAFLLDSVRYYKVAKQVKDLMNSKHRLEKELLNLKKQEAASSSESKKSKLSALSGVMRKETLSNERENKMAESSLTGSEEQRDETSG